MSKLKILRIDDNYEKALQEAATALRSGGVVAIPTDTVYGLAADATQHDAVGKLAEMKGRSKAQPIAVLVAGTAQAKSLVGELSESELFATALMDAFWPGPLTIVLPVAGGLVAEGVANILLDEDRTEGGKTDDLATKATIGIRCPDHDWVRELASQVGPIAATSANLHGTPPCITAEEVAQTFSNETATDLASTIDLIIDGGPAATAASTVIECQAGHPIILREGPITQEQIQTALL